MIAARGAVAAERIRSGAMIAVGVAGAAERVPPAR
jgi:hypothetical protein